MPKLSTMPQHKASYLNRESILASKRCGCFCCLSTFAPSEVKRWEDDEGTAACPMCGIDIVVGDASVELTDALLELMRVEWFDPDDVW